MDIYLWLKSASYFWLASHVSLEEGLIIRGILGNISFYALLGISIFGAKRLKAILLQLKMMPSARKPI